MADQPHHHHRHHHNNNNNNDHPPHQMAGNPPPDEPRPQAADPSDQPKQPIEQPQPQQPQASPASEDMLDCKWQGCADTFSNPESLYDHICDRHVGRKSTNNLCLTCQWNGCRTTTVKRDHITSHIRVHVPLKPHKCDLCNKSFKRPQDLKKHVKTHADDSMLNRTLEDAAVANGLNLLRHPMHKGPPGYYDHMRQGAATAAPGFVPALGYYQPAGNPAGYQPMYYSHGGHSGGGMVPPRPEYMNHHLQQLNHSGHGLHSHHPGAGSHERKRTLDVVSDFLGNVKRRHIDTMSYDQISRSLIPLHDGGAAGALLPVQPVEYPHYSQHQPQAQHHAAEMHHAPPAHHHHHQHHQISHHGGPGPAHGPVGPSPLAQHHILPGELESGRTRKELLDLNGLLEQMRTTIYENGPPHPTHGGSHYHAQNYTHSASAIPVVGTAADPYGGTGHQPSPQASSSSMSSTGETAAVSPPTSTVSYVSASARSPTPSSASTRSPRSRHGSAPLYPHISAASMSMSASSSSSSIYSAQSPPATLGGRGSIQDSDQRRMYSGSMLQRARVGAGPPQLRPLAAIAGAAKSSVMEAPAAVVNKIEDGRGSPTPTLTPTGAATPGVTTGAAAGSVGSPSSESDASDYTREAEERYDHWLGDMRLIESLHNYVRDQLARTDFETEGTAAAAAAPTGASSTGGSGSGSGHVEAGIRVRSSPVPPSPLPPLYPKLRVT